MLGKKDEGIDILETNVDFGYGVEISKPIVFSIPSNILDDLIVALMEVKNLVK